MLSSAQQDARNQNFTSQSWLRQLRLSALFVLLLLHAVCDSLRSVSRAQQLLLQLNAIIHWLDDVV
jgi:hypothetical protein